MRSGSSAVEFKEFKGLRGGTHGFLPLFLLLPAVGFVLVMYIYPFVLSLLRSLTDETGRFSFVNYSKAIALYGRDILFSIEVAVLGTLISTVLSLALASYIRLSNSRVSRLINSLTRIGIFLPYVVVAQMMRSFLAPHGLLNVLLANIGLVDINSPLQLFNIKGLTLGFLWKETPFITFIVLSGLQVIDDTYIEAARSVGARTHHVILRVLIPMIKPTIAIAVVLTFCTIVSTFTLPYMIVAGNPTTVTVDIAHRVTYFGDYRVASALGVFLYLIVGVMAVYYLRRAVREEVYGY